MTDTIHTFISGTRPLIAYSRGGTIEAVHRGSLAVVRADGSTMHAVGNITIPVTIRSCTKPFQLISVLRTGAAEAFDFSDSELAVAAASHSAEQIHIEAVASMLEKMSLDESHLRCGIHAPINVHSARELAETGREMTPIMNNCSGKHASMLAACLKQGWDLKAYEESGHPLQKENERITALFTETRPPLPVAVDGCTVPTFAVPLYNTALGYARLADPSHAPDGYKDLASRVFSIMNRNPYYGSGRNHRVEGYLMDQFPDQIIAKVGAEACFAVGIAPGVIDEQGAGIAIKMEDGINFNRAVDAVIIAVLMQAGLIKPEEWPLYEEYLPRQVYDNRRRAIGAVDVLFDLLEQVRD